MEARYNLWFSEIREILEDSSMQHRNGHPSKPAHGGDVRVPHVQIAQRKRLASLQAFVFPGAGTRIRTGDLLITNQLLYQLSYAG